MSKKTIGLIIISLVFIFPFRWVYLEYPEPMNSHGTLIDAGRIENVFYFLLCVFGFLAFMLLTTSDDAHKGSKH